MQAPETRRRPRIAAVSRRSGFAKGDFFFRTEFDHTAGSQQSYLGCAHSLRNSLRTIHLINYMLHYRTYDANVEMDAGGGGG